jgi:DNA modification methylase
VTTHHRVLYQSAQANIDLPDESIDLVVTSPPYPMIQMWDEPFCAQDGRIEPLLSAGDGAHAFEMMHQVLDRVWATCHRTLRPGGFACINIGDATRTVAGSFRLYTNHARVIAAMERLGFQSLPAVIWRKQTNAPNKFMGSGMLPGGAYVTLEHEYVLIFRKGDKRVFAGADQERRRHSAYFWEERNQWFSDIWDLKGVKQSLAERQTRQRSAAFPFELAYRLINMYSLQEDVVLDPFLGTGTTMLAAMAAGRSSVGVEIDERLAPVIDELIRTSLPALRQRQESRIASHTRFVAEYQSSGRELSHYNTGLDTPVMTRQERELSIPAPTRITPDETRSCYTVEYKQASGWTGELF